MSDTSIPTPTKEEIVKKPKGHFRRNWSFYFLILASLGLTAYTWFTKEYDLGYQKEIFEDQKIALSKNATALIKSNNERDLKLVAKSLAYAVANRVIFDDWEEVDLYFRQLVKSDNIEEIFLLQDDELVLVSTNKKQEGDYYKSSKMALIQETEDIIFLQDDAGRSLVVAPVLMKENRQSTVVIVYQPTGSFNL